MKTKIAIFASGGGSNAEVIMNYFENSEEIEIALIISNKEDAHVLVRAENHEIPSYVHSKSDKTDGTLEGVLTAFNIDFVVLAGYLQKIEASLIKLYPNKIVNIHPALLPAYGGKGMYGMNVHRAVEQAGEEKSGITVHYVNENYDEGNIIAQYSCELSKNDNAEEIQKKVLLLEHQYFAETINNLIVELQEKNN